LTQRPEDRPQELAFPCEFPLKVIGEHKDDFAIYVTEVVQRHVPDLDMGSISNQLSCGRKYLSVSFLFTAASRNQVDNLYRELTASKRVKWVL
jgi:putative lipoic acid-binding regulatory protein